MSKQINYSEIATSNFRKGYNCAQAVLLTYKDKLCLDDETILKLSSSFGGGMGRLREVCGAVTAMFMLAGLLNGYTEQNNDEVKAKHYELIQKLAKEFKNEYNTIICRELLELNEKESVPQPDKRTDEYYAHRPCEKFIRKASLIIEEYLIND